MKLPDIEPDFIIPRQSRELARVFTDYTLLPDLVGPIIRVCQRYSLLNGSSYLGIAYGSILTDPPQVALETPEGIFRPRPTVGTCLLVGVPMRPFREGETESKEQKKLLGILNRLGKALDIAEERRRLLGRSIFVILPMNLDSPNFTDHLEMLSGRNHEQTIEIPEHFSSIALVISRMALVEPNFLST